MTEIYTRIEKLCKERGINITMLCTACSIPRASLSDYKNGRKKSLSADTLLKIAEYFEVSVDYICRGTSSPTFDEGIKIALFGGGDNVTQEMLDEVKRYARYLKEHENENK